ncbi:hypothetical protein G7B40_019895 [Aetokthonos hydrillicola Thurmond2011]|uniref:Uncharacterized protein n=1 Tax=Aetokthonos hydrillicola Thurmond2011 TaxID=2712845 RepID=A0AAP5M924_9CYAN|nr:hypothetical protein [Aetokthonos hydrillicola]MBO3460442.1 hypothetical protein [Aetokthonos hydrillicola CCALA 1050]MBW4588481.1 hypothetical protein [Aetokthonos hydrillicola CCALA 1050]MDR9896810.1 hypothetical protein [Aetokthonos hydrillicola Thurmond2011]
MVVLYRIPIKYLVHGYGCVQYCLNEVWSDNNARTQVAEQPSIWSEYLRFTFSVAEIGVLVAFEQKLGLRVSVSHFLSDRHIHESMFLESFAKLKLEKYRL